MRTFRVETDQNFDPLSLNGLGNPVVSVSTAPGFCTVIDPSSGFAESLTLGQLGLNHLVRFTIRTKADAFASSMGVGADAEDNGLRVTVHLENTEFLVCLNRDGSDIEVLDLTTTPPTVATLDDLPEDIQAIIQ